jgi:hypothetical protein
MATINVIKTLTQSIPKEKSMSKVSIAAAAALVIGSIAPIAAHAQSYGAFAQGYGGAYSMPEHQSRAQLKHLKARVPANARGSATESGGFPTPVYQSPMYAPDAAPSRNYNNPGIPDFQLGSRG